MDNELTRKQAAHELGINPRQLDRWFPPGDQRGVRIETWPRGETNPRTGKRRYPRVRFDAARIAKIKANYTNSTGPDEIRTVAK